MIIGYLTLCPCLNGRYEVEIFEAFGIIIAEIETMKTFFTYLWKLGKEIFSQVFFWLGIVGTIFWYIPLLQNYTIYKKWFALLCIFIGFIRGNFRLCQKYVGRPSHQAVLNLIDELEYNYEMLRKINYSTVPALRDEAWRTTSNKILNVNEALRTQINKVYMNIRSAKEIYPSVEFFYSDGRTIARDLSDINKFLKLTRHYIPFVLKELKAVANKGGK